MSYDMSVSLLRSKFTTIALSILALWLAVLAVGAGIRRYGVDADVRVLESNITSTERENARLATDIQRMQKPQWLALLARQQLNEQQPGETVVLVYKSEKSDTISPPQQGADTRPNWKMWWDWLRGRRD